MTGARSENQKRRMGLAAEELLRFASERGAARFELKGHKGELGTHTGGQQAELELPGGDPCGAGTGPLSRLLGTHCRDLLCLLRLASLFGALSLNIFASYS